MGELRGVHSLRPFDTEAAVELATAWITSRASALGIRVLVLKGPVAHWQGLRGHKISTDVDILVEPGKFERLVSESKSAGWDERPPKVAPSLTSPHSTTLIHSGWPIDLDVHSYWPGFLAERSEVFELLWEERTSHVMARRPVPTPSVVDSGLIIALHALRRPAAENRLGELPALVEAADALDLSGEALRARAERLGALQTARPFLVQFGLDIPVDPDPSDEFVLWELNARSMGHTRAWVRDISAASGMKRLPLVARAVFPSPTELRLLHPELRPGLRGLAAGWLHRLAHGLREIWPALRDLGALRRRS